MTERTEEPPNGGDEAERLAAREAAAAAEEAAAIGGRAGDEDLDPAERPVVQGGGGEAEGFELSERDLAAQASHEDAGVSPADAAFSPEAEVPRTVYGEPDEVDPTGVVRDPREEDDDPGAGPGLEPER